MHFPLMFNLAKLSDNDFLLDRVYRLVYTIADHSSFGTSLHLGEMSDQFITSVTPNPNTVFTSRTEEKDPRA